MQFEDIKVDLSDCIRDWCDKYSNDIKNRQALLSDNGTLQHELQLLQMQLSDKSERCSEWKMGNYK